MLQEGNQRGGPSPSVRKVLGLFSKTKGNQKKEDRNVNVLMFDDKFEEWEEPNQIVVHATVHQVLNMVESTEDKGAIEKNDIQEDIKDNTEMKQMDGTCNTEVTDTMTEAKTVKKNDSAVENMTEEAVPGKPENDITESNTVKKNDSGVENVTDVPVPGKPENDITESNRVKKNDSAVENRSSCTRQTTEWYDRGQDSKEKW